MKSVSNNSAPPREVTLPHRETIQESPGWRQEYPFRSHFCATDGFQYHYLDEGTGAPLLMVHGNPTWSFYWRHLARHFREQYRVVVPDHLGCGLSDKPTRYPYNLQTHTANLVRLVEQLDLWNVTLLAHDWGGAIGLGTVTQLPDRFGRLILFNTGAFPPPRVPRRIAACRLPLLGRLAVQGANAFALAALTMASERPSELTSAFRDGIVAPYDSWSNRTAIYQFVRDIPLTTRHPTFDRLAKLEHQLRHLPTRPVQLIWGMRDWCFTPTCLERFIDIFPLAQVHRIEDAGHWVIEDARDQVIQMVDRFLDETRSAGG